MNSPHKNIPTPFVSQINPSAYTATARDFLQKNNLGTKPAGEISQVAEILRVFLNIPYENLSKIMKFNRMHQDALALRTPDEVWHDFQRCKLGGTCFSLIFFLQSILNFLEFNAYPVMAHMRAGKNHHCALVIDFQGRHYLADPGYVLDVPMLISSDRQVHFRNAHTAVEISPATEPLQYHLSTISRQQKQWRYTFYDLPAAPQEFVQHWLASFSWNGMHELCLSRNEKDALIYVRKYHMRQTNISGKKNFNLKKNRAEMIREAFGIPEKIVQQAEEALQENKSQIFHEKKNG